MNTGSLLDTILAAIPVTGVSIGGLVTLIVMAFVRELVYPRGYVTALREDRDKRIDEIRQDRDQRIAEYQAEVADWREAFQGAEMAMAALRAQNGELLELARTAEHVLRSLPAMEERDDHRG